MQVWALSTSTLKLFSIIYKGTCQYFPTFWFLLMHKSGLLKVSWSNLKVYTISNNWQELLYYCNNCICFKLWYREVSPLKIFCFSVRWAFKFCPGRNCGELTSHQSHQIHYWPLVHWPGSRPAIGPCRTVFIRRPCSMKIFLKYYNNVIVQDVLAKLHTNRRFWQWWLGLPGFSK